MNETSRGWLLDLYEDENDGVRLWFILEDGTRRMFRQPFQVAFYLAGATDRLHQCCLELRNAPGVLKLSRAVKQDVFKPDPICALEIWTDNPTRQAALFRRLKKRYAELTFYNADLPVQIHHAAQYGTFPLAYCELRYEKESRTLETIRILNSRWDVAPVLPPLRVMTIEPDRNPAQEAPRFLRIETAGTRPQRVRLAEREKIIPALNQAIAAQDPDLILTQNGDDWLFPFLLDVENERADAAPAEKLVISRDPERGVQKKKETSYFSYGQVIYRSCEAHLFGRCHIDTQNTLLWKDYGLDGTIETARVTVLPIEQAARASSGSGISAMQMLTALERGILVPEQKQQVETIKTGPELIRSDRGGLIYQPVTGFHTNVAQLDFTSMYPAIIINSNISPEIPLPDGLEAASPELGVVPATLKPLYEKRVELKHKLLTIPDKHGALWKSYAARASALKWLLVVCFGFLGYKNARFGRIEAHEAVTAGGREVLMRAKQVCESMGFRVLHMYVDALWIAKPSCRTVADFDDVLAEISRQTRLLISLDGIYRWVAFLPSRANDRVPVPNRYFGCFQDGSLKIRGLELRRHDSPPWVAGVQKQILNVLASAWDVRQISDLLPKAFRIFVDALNCLNEGNVAIEELILTIRISREPEAYKSPTAAVRAAMQLQERTGKRTAPGQKVRFLFVESESGVYNWDQPIEQYPPEPIDRPKYRELLARAVSSVLWPFGIKAKDLSDYANNSLQLRFEGV